MAAAAAAAPTRHGHADGGAGAAASMAPAPYTSTAEFYSDMRSLQKIEPFSKEWHTAYNAIHARVPFPRRRFGPGADLARETERPLLAAAMAGQSAAPSPGRTSSATALRMLQADLDDGSAGGTADSQDAAAATAALQKPTVMCTSCNKAVPQIYWCMKCTIKDAAAPVGVGDVWHHDLSPDKPTFRFKFELLARIRYLEAQLEQLGAGAGRATVQTVPAEQYSELQRKYQGLVQTHANQIRQLQQTHAAKEAQWRRQALAMSQAASAPPEQEFSAANSPSESVSERESAPASKRSRHHADRHEQATASEDETSDPLLREPRSTSKRRGLRDTTADVLVAARGSVAAAGESASTPPPTPWSVGDDADSDGLLKRHLTRGARNAESATATPSRTEERPTRHRKGASGGSGH